MSRHAMARSNWRGELTEILGAYDGGYDGYGNLTQQNPKTDTKAEKEIKEKPVKNKVVINPVVKEAFDEIGIMVLSLHEEAVVEELTKSDIEELQRKKDAKEARTPARQKVDEDDKWIQKATKNMRKDKPCTGDKFGSETCPPGSKRYNLAKTFKKMAKEGVNENADQQAAQLRTKRAMLNLKVSKAEQKAEKEANAKAKRGQADLNNQIAAEETILEVSPPGWGHTKSDKKKGVKKGGSAAAFKRDLDDGSFKGLPGDKTKKDRERSMFKLMWSMKNKGDKPHYKPGTNEKKKEYQEEVGLDERTRYAKETGKDFTTGQPSEKGGTRSGDSAYDMVRANLKKTGGLMSSRRKPIQPQGKKKEKGAKGYKGVTPVDKIKTKLARKRAPQPDIGSRFD